MINSMARSVITAKKWYRNMLAGNPQYSDMELISTVLGTESGAGYSFTNIPQGYKHLQVRFVLRSSGTDGNMYLRFNGDAGSNYSQHQLYGNGSTVTSAGNASQSIIWGGSVALAADASNAYAVGILDILDYTSTTKNKTTRVLTGNAVSSSFINLRSGVWLNTAAVTSFTFGSSNGSTTSASRISLYGIRG